MSFILLCAYNWRGSSDFDSRRYGAASSGRPIEWNVRIADGRRQDLCNARLSPVMSSQPFEQTRMDLLQPYCNRASTQWTNSFARGAENPLNKPITGRSSTG